MPGVHSPARLHPGQYVAGPEGRCHREESVAAQLQGEEHLALAFPGPRRAVRAGRRPVVGGDALCSSHSPALFDANASLFRGVLRGRRTDPTAGRAARRRVEDPWPNSIAGGRPRRISAGPNRSGKLSWRRTWPVRVSIFKRSCRLLRRTHASMGLGWSGRQPMFQDAIRLRRRTSCDGSRRTSSTRRGS